MSEDDAGQTEGGELDKKTGCTGTQMLLGVVVLAAAIWACTMMADAGSDSSGDTDEATAIAACEESVKEQLKAPATAQFTGESASLVGSNYRVTGAVDSENSFGALIRNDWTCTAEPTADGYRGVAYFLNGGG